MVKIYLQLFAGSSTASSSNSKSESGSHTGVTGGSSTSTVGGSVTDTSTSTTGGSISTSTTKASSTTNTSTQGSSKTESSGKTWASGTVEDNTQEHRDKYNVDYVQSDNVTNAYNKLQEALTNKPTFQSQYEDKLNEMYDSLMNTDPFSYNFNEDEMYQLYKDQYMTNAKRGMEDTMGYAASLNNGYGSSYSQSAAQQTYQNHLNDLNSIIPELRDQAYTEYKDKQSQELQKYNLTNDAYNREYGEYRDAVADYQADRNFYQSSYQDERNFDYNKFANERNYWNSEYWNEKNAEQSNSSESQTAYSETSKSQTDSTSTTNTNTSYWENSNTHSTNNYWENSNTNYWSDTNSSAWDNTSTNSLSTTTPLAATSVATTNNASPGSSANSGYTYSSYTGGNVASTTSELRGKYGTFSSKSAGISSETTDSILSNIQTMDSSKVEDYVFNLIDKYENKMSKSEHDKFSEVLLKALASRVNNADTNNEVTGEDIKKARKED